MAVKKTAKDAGDGDRSKPKRVRTSARVRKKAVEQSRHYVPETVTVACDDVDLATMRVCVLDYGVHQIVHVGDVGGQVREYTRQIERLIERKCASEGF